MRFALHQKSKLAKSFFHDSKIEKGTRWYPVVKIQDPDKLLKSPHYHMICTSGYTTSIQEKKNTMDLSKSEWHCRCTLSARWASIGPAGGEDRVTSSLLLHYVRFIFGTYSSSQCGFAKWLSDSQPLSGSWAGFEIITVWPPKTSSSNVSDRLPRWL